MHTLRLFRTLLLVLFVLPCGCTAVQSSTAASVFASPARISTLSASLSLSYTSAERGGSAGGYLQVRQPDFLRFILLSPFGTVLQETWLENDRIILVDNTQNAAFSGYIKDLRGAGVLRAWRSLQWLMDIDNHGIIDTTGSERLNRFGAKETVVVEQGRLTSKLLSSGEEARYRGYAVVNGVPVPQEIIMVTPEQERYRIVLEEIEVNQPPSSWQVSPDLTGKKVYPLSLLETQ